MFGLKGGRPGLDGRAAIARLARLGFCRLGARLVTLIVHWVLVVTLGWPVASCLERDHSLCDVGIQAVQSPFHWHTGCAGGGDE